MNCTHCQEHACRTLGDCTALRFDKDAVRAQYAQEETQNTVQAAAHLVDGGRAGSLNRLQEIAAYALDTGMNHVGLAYCYGMEKDATEIAQYLRGQGLRVSAVSCTTGGLAQDEVNAHSIIHKVSCNPLGQAAQLNAENVNLIVAVGLCLGHDMLLQKQVDAPLTTLIVKDRTSAHNPLGAIRRMLRSSEKT